MKSLSIAIVDCVSQEEALNTLLQCSEGMDFNERIILSDKIFDVDNVRSCKVNIPNMAAYNRFMIKELPDYIKTDHCLIIQNDGFIINPHLWNDKFLEYDYIGSPWRGDASWVKNKPKDYRIGNGGFSLRSKKIMELAKGLVKEISGNEDIAICATYREALERCGIKFCPFDLALEFSLERPIPEKTFNGKNTFGFHGFEKKDKAELLKKIHKVATRDTAIGNISSTALDGHEPHVLKIGFAVTDARDDAAAGDYFTALELARELQLLGPCKITFLEYRSGDGWYDANELDVLIVMRDEYDLRRLRNRSSRLYAIAWARNWIDRWAERPWANNYDYYWASSQIAADYLSEHLARPVEVVPVATNFAYFSAGRFVEDLKSDYCFTGSFWGEARDITKMLDPAKLSFKFAVFGYGWEENGKFSKYSRGGLPYSKMRDVYASTRIVIDDANSATIKWGSVNSRVFDALAAGALVVTNGKTGSDTVFKGRLPAYNTPEELIRLLKYYLTNEDARSSLVNELRQKVSADHTYTHSARVAFKYLNTDISCNVARKPGT